MPLAPQVSKSSSSHRGVRITVSHSNAQSLTYFVFILQNVPIILNPTAHRMRESGTTIHCICAHMHFVWLTVLDWKELLLTEGPSFMETIVQARLHRARDPISDK